MERVKEWVMSFLFLKNKRKRFLFLLLSIVAILQILISYASSSDDASLSQFFSLARYNWKWIVIVLIFNVAATNLLDYVARIYFPLEEGTDPNTREGNVCVRWSSIFTLIKNLNNASAVAQKIGEKFAERAGITTKEELIDRWRKTDVDVAFFFENIELIEEGRNQLRLYLKKPFWLKDRNLLSEVREARSNGEFHPVCVFYKEYCKAILGSVYENVEVRCDCEECLENSCVFKIRISDTNS